MAVDLNSCSFTGRLTRDAELRTLATGTKLVSFDIACNFGFGEYARTLFITCNMWGTTGEKLLQYLSKGQQIACTGSLEQSEWTAKGTNEKRTKLQLNCKDVILIGSRRTSASQGELFTEEEGITF